MLELQVLKIWNHPILNFEHVRRGGRIKGSEAPRSKLAQARVLSKSKGLADFQGSKSSLSGPALIFMVSWQFYNFISFQDHLCISRCTEMAAIFGMIFKFFSRWFLKFFKVPLLKKPTAGENFEKMVHVFLQFLEFKSL